MKKITAEVKVQNIVDWLEDDAEVVRVEIDKDGWNAALKSDAYGYEDSIYKFDLEKSDYNEFKNKEDYKDWLNDCFSEDVVLDDEYCEESYVIKVRFI